MAYEHAPDMTRARQSSLNNGILSLIHTVMLFTSVQTCFWTISWTLTLYSPAFGTEKHSSSERLLLLRVAPKTKTCLSFSIVTAQPSAVESTEKVKEKHVTGFDSSLITLTAALITFGNVGTM